MRWRLHGLLALATVIVSLGNAQPAEEVVDDPDTYWDERLMPIIAPHIEASKTWTPVENIDWSQTRLEANEPLAPTGYDSEIDPARLEKLFAALNLDYPGLEEVKAFYNAGDLDAAGLALVEYYRARDWPEVLLTVDEPASANTYIVVELAMIDIFTQGQVFGRQPRQENGLLDWHNKGPRDDPEWAWWLNRMGSLPRAVALWETTGDPRYVEFVDSHLADWVLANPYPNTRTFSAPWRPLEVARRIDKSWIDTLIRLRHAKDFSVETRLLAISSIPDHADAMLTYPSFSGNHLLTEKVMLAQLATAFPEFKNAGLWLEDAVITVVDLLGEQVYPDGSYEELTNHYQLVALGSFQRFLELLEAANAEELIAKVKPTIESMWNYFAYVMRPDGYGPLNNDSDRENNRKELRRALRWFDHPDWIYLASQGGEGVEPPLPASRFFPWAGHALMRDGWDEDAQWAFFDIGPYGSDHQHLDKLHLSVSFGGKDFLVDSGRYDYQPGATRDYFSGPYGHNIILLDDQWPLPGPNKVGEPMDVTAIIEDDADRFGSSVHFPARPLEGKGPRTHNRNVLYLRGYGWIVFDEVIVFEPTKVTARWLFHPDREVVRVDDELQTADTDGPNMRLVPFSPTPWDIQLLRGQTEPFEAGWYSPQFTIRHPATQAIFETTISRPTTFIWAIAPDDQRGNRVVETAARQVDNPN
ncbi:MAG: alginate lyase family protein [Puniceicoccales bacterium]